MVSEGVLGSPSSAPETTVWFGHPPPQPQTQPREEAGIVPHPDGEESGGPRLATSALFLASRAN